MVRRRWAVSLVDAALSRVDEAILPALSRALAKARARTARWPVRPVALLVVAVALAVLAITVGSLIRREPGHFEGSSPAWVGVHDGDSIPAYIELSRTELTALVAATPDRVVYALVSFDRYLTPDQVAVLLAAAPPVTTVTGYARVPLPRRQTQLVALPAAHLPGDLSAAMVQTADRKEAEAASYRQQAADEPAGAMRDTYTSNAEVAQAEAAAYRQDCGCVFALVVRGSAIALRGLAGLAQVRAVDPAADIDTPLDAVFSPPLPEQTDRVTPPTDDALPTDGATPR